jgi:chemotaxis protein MotB
MAENEEGGSSSGHSEQPIIIKKIKKGGHGHHGGAWKVAYADFVTALMAFFIVMWILASSEEVKQGVADYFNNPENYSAFTGLKTAPISIFDEPVVTTGKEGEGGEGETAPVTFSFKDSEATDTAGVSEKVMAAIKDSVNAAKNVENTGDELKEIIRDLNENTDSPEMKNILSAIQIEISKDGLRIELLESHDNNFFEIGSANLKPDAIFVLKQLAVRIGKLSNSVEIEGHTDSRGYSSANSYSNWELSSDRANSARKILENNGMRVGQIISVAGFADRKLKNPENPFDYSNRRVSIVVKNLSAEDFISD